jgi:transcriptional regulator of nitric oxide reductase
MPDRDPGRDPENKAMRRCVRWVRWSLLALLLSLDAQAVDQATLWRHIHGIFPTATALAPDARGIPVARAEADGVPLGHIFLTDRLAPIPAYSRYPISILVGVDLQGVIRGVRIVEHQEPILGAGVDQSGLDRFVGQYQGLNYDQQVRIGGDSTERYIAVDGVTGATITAMVINASIMRSLELAAPVLAPER